MVDDTPTVRLAVEQHDHAPGPDDQLRAKVAELEAMLVVLQRSAAVAGDADCWKRWRRAEFLLDAWRMVVLP